MYFRSKWSGSKSLNVKQRPRLTPRKASVQQPRSIQKKRRRKRLQHGSQLVLCEYSKFRIELNSYLPFDSIRNWRNYLKFSNTYLTVISWATETQFVCTSRQKNHLSSATHSQSLTDRPSSATWVVHYTRRMQEIMHKIYFTLLWV